MIAKQVFQAAARWNRRFTHGDALSPCEVVFGNLASCHFVMAADELGQHTIFDSCNSLPIRVIRPSLREEFMEHPINVHFLLCHPKLINDYRQRYAKMKFHLRL